MCVLFISISLLRKVSVQHLFNGVTILAQVLVLLGFLLIFPAHPTLGTTSGSWGLGNWWKLTLFLSWEVPRKGY